MKKLLLLPLLSILSFAVVGQVMDQPVTPIGTDDGIDFLDPGTDEFAFQSFTAGLTGELTQVDLALETFFQVETITIEIYSGSNEGADLSGSPIGTSTVSVPVSTPVVAIQNVNFSGIDVTAGQKYSIKIINDGAADFISYRGDLSNSYSGGQHTTKDGTLDVGADVYFVTHVLEETTPLLSDLCGTTLGASTDPNPVSVPEVSGATQYTFYFVSNGAVWSKENRSSAELDLTSVNNPDLEAGVTYSILVKAFGTGIDTSIVVGCNITTYAPTTTNLIPADCGKVRTNNTDPITATTVLGATKYEFQFYSPGEPFIKKVKSTTVYNYQDFANLFAAGTVYTARVSAYVNGVWSPLGDACSFTTAGGSQGEIQECNKRYYSWEGIVRAVEEVGATNYRFIFNDGGGQSTYTSSRSYVKLKNVSGLTGSTTYSAQVAVQKDGTYGEFSPLPCDIITPSGVPTRDGDAFVNGEEEIFLFPNPAQGSFVYFTSAIHNVEVIDALGNRVMNEEEAEYLNIGSLIPGMYIVKSDEGVVKMAVK